MSRWQRLFKRARRRVVGIWSGTHVFSDDTGFYDIKKIVDNTANSDVVEEPSEKFFDQLHSDVWDPPYEKPMDIIKRMNTKLEETDRIVNGHAARIRNAEMQYPILVNRETGLIIDGMHRLSRAFIENIPTVLVKYVGRDDMEKSRLSDDDTRMIEGFEW